MVARLTPYQKAACSNHVGVSTIFSLNNIYLVYACYIFFEKLYNKQTNVPLPFVGQERGRPPPPPPGGGDEGGIPDGHCTSYIVIVTPEGVFSQYF